MALCRAIATFFISPAGAIGSAVVNRPSFGRTKRDMWINSARFIAYIFFGPETRFLTTIVGLVMFWCEPNKHRNTIAGAGSQIITTVLVTYAVACHPDKSASIGVFTSFVRQIWGPISPFWFPSMFTSVGAAASAGVAVALIVEVSIISTGLVQWRGTR
ncbi:hypothetical protein BKA65DRAFT_578269 [Rhexocercosporidium sp. MPI-PUGE-AT-0058]|nr:hypothetical protein BKA65DRAFT_578269 [Rhexocercosporidium sp. MPI-PUGE-AT-0058]